MILYLRRSTFWEYNKRKHCTVFIVILVISHFGFEGGTLVLIASVPGHCLPFTFVVKLSP